MNSISIRWERRAVKDLADPHHRDQQRVVESVDRLRENPLEGRALTAEFKGLRRLRVGQYRVIYGFDGQELLVFVVRVSHRRDAYR